ncbi:MAG: FAD-dependent oxidoreductase [Candidatus Eutrophobiaceae bacterium]
MTLNSNHCILELGLPGFAYADLYRPEALAKLHRIFCEQLLEQDKALHARFSAYQQCQGEGMAAEEISELLVELAPELGGFIAQLFGINDAHQAQIDTIRNDNAVIYRARDEVLTPLLKHLRKQPPEIADEHTVITRFELLLRYHSKQISIHSETSDSERLFCELSLWLQTLNSNPEAADQHIPPLRAWLDDQGQDSLPSSNVKLATALNETLQNWIWLQQPLAPEPSEIIRDWLCFKTVRKVHFNALVEHELHHSGGFDAWRCNASERRMRDGFHLTDPRFDERRTQYEIHHCIYCHTRDTDSCSKGMRNKKGEYKTNPLGITVTGCPLEEKISEMHLVKKQGDNIGALALIIIDNPMCPGTGHRICNDCMKGCIYQKTEPVDIPQIETNVLTDTLELPWGLEIYSLLTRWNPLNVKQPYALPHNGKKALVVGLGPAGYTLAHYLLNEGFGVVGIDALKLEPLPIELTGDANTPPSPIRDFKTIYEKLDERMMAGFGGVAEYGITVRWDKNFLKVIYLNLLRRTSFRSFGGVRFGGTLTIEDAWGTGFDHIALATGAGKPTIINLRNNLIRGIRKASDFLMALQLTGAAKVSSLANLQVRLPAGVIGGGLTGVDTATEVAAYYPVQVEKTLHRYEELCECYGKQRLRHMYDDEEWATLNEFLEHGRAVRAERTAAKSAGRPPDFGPLMDKWGGVTLFYRKGVEDSPAYRQNHEEIREALCEGMQIAPGMSPIEALPDSHGALRAVRFNRLHKHDDGSWKNADDYLEVPLRSLFIAAGTSPNTIYELEHPNTFRMDAKFFQRYEPSWNESGDMPKLIPMNDTTAPKLGKPAPFTSWSKNGKFISFYGDNHPIYAGNVVKAMASAKDGYPYITRLFAKEISMLDPAKQAERDKELQRFFAELESELGTVVVEVKRLTPTIVEVLAKAPMQARKFQPGQFYRVQNLESNAQTIHGTALAAEGLALTGAWVNKDEGLISLITLEMGSSSKLCALWKPGERISVMGVTGTPTEIPKGQTMMLIGGGLGNAVLFSIGKALRASGNRIIYFAGYKKREDVFRTEDIEAASDVVVWSVDRMPESADAPLPSRRAQDCSHVGNIIETICAYAEGKLGPTPIALQDVERIIAIGSDGMMNAVKNARHAALKPYLKPRHTAIGSINSPMQCMMKGVCAQCLCRHVDPDTGQEYFVYSCYNQDQELERVDFDHLHGRLKQNSVQEKLSDLWLEYLLATQAEAQAETSS